MNFMAVGLLVGLFSLVMGCVSPGEKQPPSKLNYLNGDEYRATTIGVGGVPVPVAFDRKTDTTAVSGNLRLPSDNALYHKKLRFEKLVLSRNGNVVMSTQTDENGLFRFQGNLPDGSYVLSIESKLFKGEKTIEVKGYEVKNIDLPVSRR